MSRLDTCSGSPFRICCRNTDPRYAEALALFLDLSLRHESAYIVLLERSWRDCAGHASKVGRLCAALV